MNLTPDFDAQAAAIAADAAARPQCYGEGVRLLFSCGARNILGALEEAGRRGLEARGLEARGVGRLHILVEIENVVPDKDWFAREGAAIAQYFDAIGGVNPQIGIDRGIG